MVCVLLQGKNLSASGTCEGPSVPLSLSLVSFFCYFLCIYEKNAREFVDIVRLASNSGLGGGFRGYSASLSPEERILKLEEDDQLAEDDIAKIRAQFDAAKQSFFKIPEAVKEMPKMHPKGIRVYLLIHVNNCLGCVWEVRFWAF